MGNATKQGCYTRRWILRSWGIVNGKGSTAPDISLVLSSLAMSSYHLITLHPFRYPRTYDHTRGGDYDDDIATPIRSLYAIFFSHLYTTHRPCVSTKLKRSVGYIFQVDSIMEDLDWYINQAGDDVHLIEKYGSEDSYDLYEALELDALAAPGAPTVVKGTKKLEVFRWCLASHAFRR